MTQKTEPEKTNESVAEAAKDENVEEVTPVEASDKEDLVASIIETVKQEPPRPATPVQTHETIIVPVSQSDFVLGKRRTDMERFQEINSI